MYTLRLAWSIVFASVLFLTNVGEAHAMYAYLNPCQALGVACPDEGTTPATQGGGGPQLVTIPEVVTDVVPYVPPPLVEALPYTPPVAQTYGGLPVHSAAPLPRTGMGAWGVLLSLVGTSGCMRWWARRTHDALSNV